MSESEVYQAVANLFQEEEDLMRDFKSFLPDAVLSTDRSEEKRTDDLGTKLNKKRLHEQSENHVAKVSSRETGGRNSLSLLEK